MIVVKVIVVVLIISVDFIDSVYYKFDIYVLFYEVHYNKMKHYQLRFMKTSIIIIRNLLFSIIYVDINIMLPFP